MDHKKTVIIAEAGVNHNGDLNLAKKLIDIAAEAGADYVKFQTFTAENLLTRSAKKATYQENTTSFKESQFEMIKKLELDVTAHQILFTHCESKQIKFLSTAFDLDSVDLLQSIGIDLFKIPSGEITNYPLLAKIAQTKRPIVLSTGMANLSDIEAAIKVLVKHGANRNELIILHCNTQYPTPMQDVNLKAMDSMRHTFNIPVGYSDHTLGIEVPIAAVAMGSVMIEKHFTLDRSMEGPDHAASLEPSELKAMISSIRNIELAMGSPVKEPSPSEQANKVIARKSIVAAKVILKGEVLSENNLTTKRPGTGISPMQWENIIGITAPRDFITDELIEI